MEETYIYQLSPLPLRELCKILDQNDIWERLGFEMQYDNETLELIKAEKSRGKSPTDELLAEWGQLNHTVTELFHLLSKLKQYPAMKCLKPYVDQKYHRMIRSIEDDLLPRFQDSVKINSNEKEIEALQNRISTAKNEIQCKCQKMKEIPEVYVKTTESIPTRDDNFSSSVNDNDNNQNLANSIVKPDILTPHVDYSELTVATNNWDSSRILGKGGYGTVYEGFWKWIKVAVKRLQTNSEKHFRIELEQSLRELIFLNQYKHDNILSVYAYSTSGEYPCLVYQYMPGNNLDRRLRPKEATDMLNWNQRLNVAVGVARGLHFLHTVGEKPLIHGDIKPANILLDACNQPKIGDFGLAREGPKNGYTHIEVSKILGTRPYLPDDFLQSKCMSTKVDTFSFGIVLFEIGTGLGAYIRGLKSRESKFLRDYILDYDGDVVDLIDKRCPGEYSHIYSILMNIGKKCVQKRAKDRPEMKDILEVFSELF